MSHPARTGLSAPADHKCHLAYVIASVFGTSPQAYARVETISKSTIRRLLALPEGKIERRRLCHPRVSDHSNEDLDPGQTMPIEQLSLLHLGGVMKEDAGEDASEKEGEMEVDTEALTEATTSSNVPRPQPQASKPNLCPSKPTLAPNSHHPKPKPPLIQPSKPIVRIYAATAFSAAELKPLSTSLPPIVSSRIWRLSIDSAENRPPYDHARPSLTYLPFTINGL
ncbi:hypothetical protein NP233_g12390 [Leucocoprinus birnbaumii]|uniref:Uncharacterized protein n=1 Tax=Leucocoprinus birnbaumii TaxID=56174 RepID=A0AAD5VFS6_9AGAR|nr:hypothetical protein NP233_g12390 [Leucocoprinus birnbaumii]